MSNSVAARQIERDRKVLMGLKTLPDYSPPNPAYSVEALVALEERMVRARERRLRAWKEYQAARAEEREVERAFHDGAVGARLSVKAQYGRDSFAIKTVGLKRRSDIRR